MDRRSATENSSPPRRAGDDGSLTSAPSPDISDRPPAGRSRLGWGIVGASTAAAGHFLPALRTLDLLSDRAGVVHGQPLAIMSNNRRRAHEFATRQHIPHAYDDLSAFLARTDIQCVYVANQMQRHAHVVSAALDAGKHLFCEPPISPDPEEAELLLQRATIRGLHLWTNQFWRYDSVIRHMRQEYEDGSIGDLIGATVSNRALLAAAQQTWRLQPGAGIVHDRTAQDIDLLLFLLGQRPQDAWAVTGQRLFGAYAAEEELASILRLGNRVLVRTHDSYHDPHAEASVTLHGTYATLHAAGWATPGTPTSLSYHRRGETTQLDVPYATPFTVALTEFMRAVHAIPPLNLQTRRGSDALDTLQIVAALQQAASRGNMVSIRYTSHS